MELGEGRSSANIGVKGMNHVRGWCRFCLGESRMPMESRESADCFRKRTRGDRYFDGVGYWSIIGEGAAEIR
jgi:hypothetical protein